MIGAKFISYRKQREAEIIDGLDRGLARVGALVENQAKKNVSQTSGHPRVQTGRLRASITHEVVDGAVYVGTNVFYGRTLEHGTSWHPPYPWLFPAVEMTKKDVVKELKGGKFSLEAIT